ncbi:Armadillo repeat-containing protein 2 [Frankliniella fusca]|uniref:Armadillo repeat-containing protein 2 n=1 Tax=Frankliniella fusca TaxID=407009 RepID=A0AAE1LP77_9NEOP|nr:Armadillo repeat-containing protein 2 [Frankliniella fusca]
MGRLLILYVDIGIVMEKKAMSGRGKANTAFYEPPTCVRKTSSEIINEARASIMHSVAPSSSSGNVAIIQPVNTKRPFTPRDGQRTLFGRSRGSGQRPPSSFSLRYLQNQESGESGDASSSGSLPTKRAQLMPMTMSGVASLDMVKEITGNSLTRLPSISKIVDAQDIRRKRRHQFRTSTSLDNLPEELEGPETFSHEAPIRNAYSSPKEHIERLSDCLDVVGLQKSKANSSSSENSKTRRKLMKHDDLASKTGFSSEDNFSSAKDAESRGHHLNQRTMLSLDVGNFSHDQIEKPETQINPLTERRPNKNSTLQDIEHNLFGPNIISEGLNSPYFYSKGDGGVFGEKVQDKNGQAPHGFELDKESAIYDNCINEAKLANSYGGKIPEDSNIGASKIHQILNKLTELALSEGPDAMVMLGLDELYNALRGSGLQGKVGISSKIKTQVLKCVYKFVERSEDALLLKLARIIFCLPVTGSNLAGVCKLVFKVARNDKNDILFSEGNILDLFIDALGSASPLEDAEACVYGYGALKFLTMNNQLLNHILDLGTLDLMVLHLKIVNSVRSEGGRIPEQTSHAIFQLTGALRNIAGEESTFPMLEANGAVCQLCISMEFFSCDLDLVTNIARTFSIISTNDDCCQAIATYKNCTKLFATLFSKYPGHQDIVVRLGYAMGNLLAKNDEIRLQLLDTEGAMDTLLDLLQLYLQKDLELATNEAKRSLHRDEQSLSIESGSDGSIEDVIVKIIRIVANMSMNMEVGERLTCLPVVNETELKDGINDSWKDHLNEKDTAVGNRAIGLLLMVLRRKSIAESAELVLSTLSTFNNLTYYPSGAELSIFNAHLMDISQALYTLLMSNLDECLVEATKVLGNLTRSKPARDFLLETGGLNQLLKFLSTDNHELLRSTTGVLVNLMADADKREALQRTPGISRLIAILLYHGETDWQLSSLICQVLWNYCIDMTNLNWLGADQSNQLVEVLVDFLDDERFFGARNFASADDSSDATNGMMSTYQQWEEFAVIATNLLEKMESYRERTQQTGLPHSLPMNQLNINANAAEMRGSQWEEIPPKKTSLLPTTSIS